MDWKEFFKPTKGKIITVVLVAIVITFIYWSGIQALKCYPRECPVENPCGNYPNIIDTKCCDECVDLNEFIVELFKAIIIPFVISFILIHLFYSIIKRIIIKFKK